MKKLLILLTVTIAFVACQPKQGADDIRKQINAHKMKITEIENQIKELEQQLAQDSTAGDQDFSILVKTHEMHRDTFEHFVEVTGFVESEFQSNISPEMNGQIKEIMVEEGQTVSKGQLLVKLKSDVTDKSIQEVRKALELANTIYVKQEKLWNQKIGSEVQYLQAKNNKESLEKKLETLEAQLDMASIRAPYAGIVDEIFAKKGEMASPGLQVLQLVNLNKLKIDADISEYYIPYVNEGDRVRVKFPTYPDLVLDDVRIVRIGNIVNQNNRTVKITLSIPNPKQMLKPNMLSKVVVNDFVNYNAMTLPTVVIKKDADQNHYVYVMEEKGGKRVSTKREVETGKSFGSITEIVNGLEDGESVIVEGYNLVKNGSVVRVK